MEFEQVTEGVFIATKKKLETSRNLEMIPRLEEEYATLVYENMMMQSTYDSEIASLYYLIATGGE